MGTGVFLLQPRRQDGRGGEAGGDRAQADPQAQQVPDLGTRCEILI